MRIKEYFSMDEDVRRAVKDEGKINHLIEKYNEKGYRSNFNIPDKYPSTKYKSWFTASDLGSKSGKSLCDKYYIGCIRKMFFKGKGVKKKSDITPELRRRWDAGSALHEVFQRYTMGVVKEKMGIDEAKAEFEIVPEMGGLAEEYRFVGKVDLLYRKGYYLYISEIKSKGHNAFVSLGSPDDEHITQLNTYLALLDVPVGGIYYIGFSGAVPTKEFMVEFDQDRWDACKRKMDKAKELVQKNELPPAEGMEVSPYFCRSCPYYYKCADKTIKTVNGDLSQ